MSATLRVVVVDDEDHVRPLVRVALHRSAELSVVGESDGSIDSLVDACTQAPHVVLLDQHLDGVLGTELIGDVLRACPRAMIAVLTSAAPELEEAQVLSAGAFVFYEKAMIATSLADHIIEDYRLFCRALEGEDVVAPAALSRRPSLDLAD